MLTKIKKKMYEYYTLLYIRIITQQKYYFHNIFKLVLDKINKIITYFFGFVHF